MTKFRNSIRPLAGVAPQIGENWAWSTLLKCPFYEGIYKIGHWYVYSHNIMNHDNTWRASMIFQYRPLSCLAVDV